MTIQKGFSILFIGPGFFNLPTPSDKRLHKQIGVGFCQNKVGG